MVCHPDWVDVEEVQRRRGGHCRLGHEARKSEIWSFNPWYDQTIVVAVIVVVVVAVVVVVVGFVAIVWLEILSFEKTH